MEEEKGKTTVNAGGRPSLEKDEALVYRYYLRVNKTEDTSLRNDYKQWVDGRKGSFADFLRSIILNRHNPINSKSTSDPNEQVIEMTQTLHGIRQYLKHIDTNYNQVTKRINSIDHTAKLYYEVQTSKVIIDKLEPLLTQIDTLVKAQTEAIFKK